MKTPRYNIIRLFMDGKAPEYEIVKAGLDIGEAIRYLRENKGEGQTSPAGRPYNLGFAAEEIEN